MKWSKITVVWIIIIVLLLLNNWSIPFWDQDEAAYAGFGINILDKNDWLIPEYLFSSVHRKPPFHFWNIALSYKIFGINEFAVRFPAFLSILGTLLMVYYQVRKFRDSITAINAVWVLSTSFLVMALAKVSVTDGTVLFSMTLAGFSLINIIKGNGWKWVLYFWIGILIGTLTKGPPVILFSGALGLSLLIFHKNRWTLLRTHPWFFLPVALLPLFLWGYLAYQQDGGVFINWMLDWYILRRVDGQVFGQTGPPGTHLLLLIGFFIFYIAYLFPSWITTIKQAMKKDEWSLFMICWLVSGWFFFEFTPSKLPAYAIGAHIPIAIMIATQMQRSDNKRILILIQFALQILIGLALIVVPLLFPNKMPIKHDNIVAIGILWLIVSTISFYYFIKEGKSENAKVTAVRQYFCNSVLLAGVWILIVPITQYLSASYQVGQEISRIPNENKNVYIAYNPGEQPSLPVYINNNGRKPINIVNATINQMDSVVKTDTHAILIVNREVRDNLRSHTSWNEKVVMSPIIDRKGISEYFILWK